MKVTSLHIYPVKSCRVVNLSLATITATGFENDRRWMLVDENDQFLSQRISPKMALIQALVFTDRLNLKFGSQEINLPHYTEEHGQRTVTIFDSRCLVQDYGDEAADLLSTYLEKKVRFVTMNKSFHRNITSSKAMQKDILSFADGFPFLLATQSSLAELNGRLDVPVLMDRFRANIVIDGTEPFAEDHWKKIAIGDAVFFLPKACTRCPITTVDQQSGERHRTEPLKTLASFRMQERKVVFGMNLQHDHGSGYTIKVGDAVRIIA